MRRFFIAYPARPSEVGQTISKVKSYASGRVDISVETWERDDLGGQQIIQPILEKIKESDVVVADVTSLNFNVTYELGYAIGLGKRTLPIRSRAFTANEADIQKLGIYDTLIRQEYESADNVLNMLVAAEAGQRVATKFPPDPLPLYIVFPAIKTDDMAQLAGRGLRAGLRSRTFDPAEEPRMGATAAVRSVATSAGVIIPLLDPERQDANIHNLRCAFVAGVAHALGKPTLLFKKGDWPTPLDVREEVETYYNESQLGTLFSGFAERVHEARFLAPSGSASNKSDLSNVNLGNPAAENEESLLREYFLERGEFRQVLDGRTNIVVGRKGSGKTAVYVRARDQLKEVRSKVIVDLSPEAHQLKQLKDVVLKALAAGSKEFLLAAFWEYVLLLEICAKIIDKDRDVHKRNHKLFEPYQRLLAQYRADSAAEGVSFSDRLLRLIERIAERYKAQFGRAEEISLSQGEITNLLYETTLADLRNAIEIYAKEKDGIHVLFDNLDKGWNAEGLENSDIVMIRTLLDAGRKLENDFNRTGTDFHCTIFLRNDVYEVLLSQTADRGKLTRVLVDWPQADLLKQMVRRRLAFALDTKGQSLDAMWHRICVPLIDGEDSLDYLIRRSLMRPRYLLRLINYCIGNAINFERNRVDEKDVEIGESAYSTDIITEVDLEIRDILCRPKDVLYAFLGEKRQLPKTRVVQLLAEAIEEEADRATVFVMLLWHGVLGFQRSRNDVQYIFDVNYDLKRLQGAMAKFGGDDPVLEVNPAFWAGLEMQPS